MRVLWLGHFTPFPPIGGAPQRSYNLLRRLAETDEVHFVGLSQRGHQPSEADIAAAERDFRGFCASVELRPARFASSRPGKALALTRALLRRRAYGDVWLGTSEARRLFADAVARIRPDVLHVDSLMIAGVAPDLPRAAVLNHHNIESHMMARRAENAGGFAQRVLALEARRLEEFERRTAARYARHLVCSTLDGERLAANCPGIAWDVVANGVDTNFFAPAEVEEQPLELVFSGRMNWYPNEHGMLRFLDELWNPIREAEPNATLSIVGMNPTSTLRAAAAAKPGVEVTGFVPDVRARICRAAVYVCPILDGGGTRLKILDALSLARPIVGTPLAVEGIDVRDEREVLVRPFGSAFVDGILALLRDAKRRAALGAAAREVALARYDWSVISRHHRAALCAAAER